MAAGGGAKRRYQYCTDISGTIVYLRALQGHSGRNLIDPALQDNVIIQSRFFQHIYHIGCAFNLHSIINNGLIPGGQNSSKRQTVFFLPNDPRDEGHQDPAKIDFNVHSAWKKHQDAVFWVDINLAIQKGLTFYQTQSKAIILQGTLPAYCIPKVVRLKTGEVLYEKSYMSLRPPPKISLRHDHDWTRGKVPLGSTVDQQPEGKVVRQSRGEVQHATFSQLTQPMSRPICDRSGQPDNKHEVFVDKGETSWSQEIKEKSSHEELCSSDRSGQPDITPSVIKAHNLSENIRVEQTHDRSGQPDECNCSKAQIRTLLEEQRQTIIAEYREKASHHELQAAHAEEERRILQGQLWRQKLEFREARQQSLTEMEESRIFQSSTFDTIARRKLIEDQNTILGLSGRVQELTYLVWILCGDDWCFFKLCSATSDSCQAMSASVLFLVDTV